MKFRPHFLAFALGAGLAWVAPTAAQAQVGVNINIGLPAWGPAVPQGTQYYYIPEIDGYYDIYTGYYLVFQEGQWVTLPYIDGYDPYYFHPVPVSYVGPQPWLYIGSYRARYPQYVTVYRHGGYGRGGFGGYGPGGAYRGGYGGAGYGGGGYRGGYGRGYYAAPARPSYDGRREGGQPFPGNRGGQFGSEGGGRSFGEGSNQPQPFQGRGGQGSFGGGQPGGGPGRGGQSNFGGSGPGNFNGGPRGGDHGGGGRRGH